jgi:hypothetical protein
MAAILFIGPAHAQEDGEPPQAAAPTPHAAKPKPQSKVYVSEFQRAEAANARAMRWTCDGCTGPSHPRFKDRHPSKSQTDIDEPVITDPAQAPIDE